MTVRSADTLRGREPTTIQPNLPVLPAKVSQTIATRNPRRDQDRHHLRGVRRGRKAAHKSPDGVRGAVQALSLRAPLDGNGRDVNLC